MNEFLANLYNTGGESDQEEMIEKMASAQVLTDIAAQQGKDLSEVDWDQLSTEDIHDLIKEASGEYDDDDEGDEDFQEKLAEWDFAGRTMAHAFYQEQVKIAAKTAPAKWDTPNSILSLEEATRPGNEFLGGKRDKVPKAILERRLSKKEVAARATARRAQTMPGFAEKLKNVPMDIREKAQVGRMARASGAPKGAQSWGRRMSVGARRAGWKAGQHILRNKGAYGGAAGGLAALGLGYGAYKMNKNSSMLDELAAERAQEFLNEKTASYDEDDDVEQAIQQRAAEMLYEAGYGDLLD